MVKACSVKGCNNSKDNVHYFKFPTSRTLKSKWLKVVKTTSKVTVHSLICSQHFSEDDYESVRGKVRLKSQVVPTVFTGDETDITKQQGNHEKINYKLTDLNVNYDSRANDEEIDELALRSNHSQNDHHTDGCEEKRHFKEVVDNARVVTNCVDKTEKVIVNIRKDSLDSLEELNRHIINDERSYTCIDSSSDVSQESKTLESDKQDIEEILTHYQIQQNHKLLSEQRPEVRESRASELISNNVPPDKHSEVLEVEFSPPRDSKSADPVFIEISVDQNSGADGNADQSDCLMLLENVQVDIDPATLMLPEREPDDEEDIKKKSPDPISLLTSSDESDVIIEEPKIDIVEVSDEDEDDVPLVKLVTDKQKLHNSITKLMWGGYEYYCIQCKFKTLSSSEYNRHCKDHSTAVQICSICNYTTASQAQYARHKRKHKEERKFRCHLCDYKARHNMSLVYHLKSHSEVSVQINKKKKYQCDICVYSTVRKSDLNRHIRRRHAPSLSSESDA